MDSKILSGTALAKKHEETLKQKLFSLVKGKRRPKMVSFCNTQDPPSVKYTKMKKNKAADIGIEFLVEEYTSNINKDEIISKLHKYNSDSEIDGIMFQMPLPEELEEFQDELISNINPQKDVDGLQEDSPYIAATAKAVISLMDEADSEWKQKKIAIVGITGEVGRPLAKIFKENGVNLVGINRSIGNLETDLLDRDIVIGSTGKKGLLKPHMIKNGVVLIDVGLGDFEEGCYEKASKYTPVIGGVGPMTVISLMENAVEAYKNL